MYSLETALAYCDKQIEEWQKQKEFLRSLNIDLSPEFQNLFWRGHSVDPDLLGKWREEDEKRELTSDYINKLRKAQSECEAGKREWPT